MPPTARRVNTSFRCAIVVGALGSRSVRVVSRRLLAGGRRFARYRGWFAWDCIGSPAVTGGSRAITSVRSNHRNWDHLLRTRSTSKMGLTKPNTASSRCQARVSRHRGRRRRPCQEDRCCDSADQSDERQKAYQTAAAPHSHRDGGRVLGHRCVGDRRFRRSVWIAFHSVAPYQRTTRYRAYQRR